MPDEIVDIENCAKSYLMNARECYDQKDYQRALSYLEAAKDEIELLAKCAAQQNVQRTCAVCGADSWRDAICPDTLEICTVCGTHR